MRRALAAAIGVVTFGSSAAAQQPSKTAFVHIDSGSSITLERATPEGFRPVCFDACDAQVPVETKLRIVGDVPASNAFVLRGIAGEGTTIHVRPPGRTKAAGFVLIGLGSASLAATQSFAIAGAFDCGFILSKANCYSGFWTAAIGTGVVGAVLLGAGIVLAAIASVTSVDGRGVVPFTSPLRPPAEDLDPGSPTFLSDGPAALPVLRASF